jgi:hypothetical protein
VKSSLFVGGMMFEVEMKRGNPLQSVGEEETVLGLKQDPAEGEYMRLN